MGQKIIIIALAFLTSCSASWHIQRAIIKDPSLLERDTVVVHDTIRTYTEHTEVDSVFMISNDTIIVEKNNLKIKHWIHQDSVFIEGECDSIFVEVPYKVEVPYETIRYEERFKIPWWIWLIAFVILVFYLGKKYLKL